MLEARRVADRQMLDEKYLNPQWVRPLEMNVEYTRCMAGFFRDGSGRQLLVVAERPGPWTKQECAMQAVAAARSPRRDISREHCNRIMFVVRC
jgi:hypothetical protein